MWQQHYTTNFRKGKITAPAKTEREWFSRRNINDPNWITLGLTLLFSQKEPWDFNDQNMVKASV